MRALREGCSPEDLHRLLIGVSAGGFNVMPFMDLLGCCRCVCRWSMCITMNSHRPKGVLHKVVGLLQVCVGNLLRFFKVCL